MNTENLVEWELVGETKVFGDTYPSATSSTTNPALPDLEFNPDRYDDNHHPVSLDFKCQYYLKYNCLNKFHIIYLNIMCVFFL
jgi:hypothetical protein